MKRIFLFLLILLLAGCQEKKEEDGDSKSPDKVPGSINPPKREGRP